MVNLSFLSRIANRFKKPIDSKLVRKYRYLLYRTNSGNYANSPNATNTFEINSLDSVQQITIGRSSKSTIHLSGDLENGTSKTHCIVTFYLEKNMILLSNQSKRQIKFRSRKRKRINDENDFVPLNPKASIKIEDPMQIEIFGLNGLKYMVEIFVQAKFHKNS